MPVRVVVLAADPFVLAGVSAELSEKPGIRLVEHGAEVAVVLPDGPGDLLAGIDPGTRVVLVSDDPRWGADGMVLLPRRKLTTASLLRAISDAEHGLVTPRAPRSRTPDGLSRREIAVLRLLAEGRATAEIAAELAYAERTVKNIVSGVLARLDLRNRTHAVAYAVRAGLI
ncbi:LuxR C-terminal-related transcriptional regulator [Amycolatopsis sp. YIM 10]|uniref:LuxR C-terminal-related transcriptional regulator n=1 Tax=Amycolatopsis sp. YIM 10 TaxID=2653857 RepID=UPI0012908B04|nr:LuxR C-terminal-related transcriptional regulator [Amycolatopsis sp. YIM 10]QFU89441.1 Transcriptional regulatory protein DegU [Amycolatopsis sp. YIM 10]